MKRKDLFLGGGILFAACVLFLVMNLMQYVRAKESGQKENQEKQVVIKVDGKTYWGYGMHEDIITASIDALCAAINRWNPLNK